MTTTVVINPHGHNAEVIVYSPAKDEAGGDVVSQRTVKLDPHVASTFYLHGDISLSVYETPGWNEPVSPPSET